MQEMQETHVTPEETHEAHKTQVTQETHETDEASSNKDVNHFLSDKEQSNYQSRVDFTDDSKRTVITGHGAMRIKKVEFDEINDSDKVLTLKKGVQSICHLYDLKRPFSVMTVSDDEYFCDWYPELFGIDEDEMPDSEGEGFFGFDWEDIEESVSSSDEEKGSVHYVRQHPRYGRRAKKKPILEKENHEKYECLCRIDRNYSRHHIPHFGKRKKGEELRVPHFRTFWEDLKEQTETKDWDRWSKIFEAPEEEPEYEKGLCFRPTPKFPGSNRSNMKQFRQQLLASFRPLDCREVRRYRMPYAEALYLELQEDCYLDSAEFFKNLIIKDHFVHEASPTLGKCFRDNRVMMRRVVAFLKLSERLNKREEPHKSAVVLLKSGRYFSEFDMNWWWLAEEFYTKALQVSQKCALDGGKTEAITNYILGTFLLDYVHRVQPAQEHLLRARELSMGKDWSANRILGSDQDTVYKECANYLCRALIAVSRELRGKGKPEEALPHICRSHKLCQETRTSRWDIEMETYFELGLTYQEVGYFDWALTAFRKYLELALLHNLKKNICDAFLEIAICYKRAEDYPRCYRNIFSFLKYAEASEDENLVAFGNRYLGEYYLDRGNSKVAAEHFKKSFLNFLDQFTHCSEIPFKEWQQEHFNLGNDVELTRVLTGLAYGESLTKPICNLIVSAKEKNQKSITKLIDWKNYPEKFLDSDDWAVEYEADDEGSFTVINEDLPAYQTTSKADEPGKEENSETNLSEDQELRTVRFAV